MLSTLVHHGFVSNERADFKTLPVSLTPTIFTAVLCEAGGGCPGDVLQLLRVKHKRVSLGLILIQACREAR